MSARILYFALLVPFAALSVFMDAALSAEEKPVQVYILAGQSNMDGYGGLEALDYQVENGDRKELFAHLQKDGEWVVRDDVWIVFGKRKGPLTAGYGVGEKFMGVEWEFGIRVGEHHDAKVLLIKTSWGGASIRRKFRPPSSGEGAELVKAEYENRLKQYEKKVREKKNAKKPELEEIRKIYGTNYRRMIQAVRETLGDLQAVIPEYQGQGYEMAGFVWFQGFNDQFGGAHEEYETHLANLIRDVRKEFKKPRLPFVVGQMGHGGTVEERETRGLKPIGEATRRVKEAQAAVAGMDEFKGTVALVRTDAFWDWKAQGVFDKGWKEHLEEWKRIGAHYPYHYLGSPYTFLKAGGAFGTAMLELHRHK